MKSILEVMSNILSEKGDYSAVKVGRDIAGVKRLNPFKYAYNLVSWQYNEMGRIINKEEHLKNVSNAKINSFVQANKLFLHPSYVSTNLFPIWFDKPEVVDNEYVTEPVYYSIMYPID